MSDAEEFNRAREVVVEYAQALSLPRTPSTDLDADLATVRQYVTAFDLTAEGIHQLPALAALDRLVERARRAEECVKVLGFLEERHGEDWAEGIQDMVRAALDSITKGEPDA